MTFLRVLLAILLPPIAGRGTITLPFSFSPNTTILSAQVNSCFTTIFNDYNGNVSDVNVLSLSESKVVFAGTGGHDHSGGTKGTSTLPNYVQVLDRTGTAVSVINTAAATTVYVKSVPAGALGTTRKLRLSIIGFYTNNTGADRTLTITCSYGGTTVLAVSAVLPANAASRVLRLLFEIDNLGVTNNQHAYGEFKIGTPGTAVAAPGAFDVPTFSEIGESISGITIDTTVATNLGVSFQHSFASASLDVELTHAVLELV